MFYQTNRMQAAESAEKMLFLSLVTLTFDLQTRPSEGPTRLLCEFSTNPFSGSPRYFIHKCHKQKKTQTDGAKNNLPQFTACGNDNASTTISPGTNRINTRVI